ncbi:Fungal Zn2-Cys6 binuclear cluster domain-containing protein [Cladophialophora immunda]|nr:Fungal Zn2-Cys6 binuclear cluster domain-containing protein [Cladophialophora immunda]
MDAMESVIGVPYHYLAVEGQTPPSSERQAPRRRATKACLPCRARKVRCDATIQYPDPCTNCQLDGKHCGIPNKRLAILSGQTGSVFGVDHLCRRPATKKLHLLLSQSPVVDPNTSIGPASEGIDSTSQSGITSTTLFQSSTAQHPPSHGSDPSRSLSLPFSNDSRGQSNTANDGLQSVYDVNQPLRQYETTQLDLFQMDIWPDWLNIPDNVLLATPSDDNPLSESNSNLASERLSHSTEEQPLHWVQARSAIADHCQGNEEVDKELLSLPIPSLVEKLLHYHFLYVYPSSPVVSEYEIYHLIHRSDNGTHGLQPISLALLNAIMFTASAYLTKDEASSAGFSTVLEMRDGFYRRATELYDQGYESSPIRQLQICLLLSLRRKYPDGIARGTILVTFRPGMDDLLQFEAFEVNTRDLEEETSFSWLLRSEEKSRIALVFIARFYLLQAMETLAHIIPRGTIDMRRGQVIGKIEELESSLAEWYVQYKTLIEDDFEGSSTSFIVSRDYLRLNYQYCLSALHSLSLCVERSAPTSWSTKLRDASRYALEDSANDTVKTIESLLAKDLFRFLPFCPVIMVFIPLAINSSNLKYSTKSNPTSAHNLSICFRALENLAGQWEGITDFLMALNDACLSSIHKNLTCKQSSIAADTRGQRVWNSPNYSGDPSDVWKTDAVSQIVKLQVQSFALGEVK